MPNIFPSREELMQLPLNKLRTIDVKDRFEEELLQAVINLKTEQQPPQTPIKTSDVPDIYNSTDEAKWQKILDDRRAGLKPQVEVKSDASGIEIKVEQAEVKSVANKCDKCDFVGKNANGLRLHSKKHIIKPLAENK